MGARLIQRGDTLDYVNGTAAVIPAGKVIVAGTFVGVVQNDIPVGALGAIAITGVWAIEKGSDAFDVGAPVYFDSANGRAAASGVYAGRAVKTAESGDDVVLVRLEPAGDAAYANTG